MNILSVGHLIAATYHFAPRRGHGLAATSAPKDISLAAKQFGLNEEQTKHLRELNETEKQLRALVRSPRELARERMGLKAGDLKLRLELLLKRIPTMDAREAKAALAELKRIAAELKQLRAGALSAEPSGLANTANLAAASDAASNATANAAALANTPNENPSGLAESISPIPEPPQAAEQAQVETKSPTVETGRNEGGNGEESPVDKLKKLLKTVAHMLKKRLEELQQTSPPTQGMHDRIPPDNTVDPLGAFIDIKA